MISGDDTPLPMVFSAVKKSKVYSLLMITISTILLLLIALLLIALLLIAVLLLLLLLLLALVVVNRHDGGRRTVRL